jgi:amino acid adenylation domain-containing protein
MKKEGSAISTYQHVLHWARRAPEQPCVFQDGRLFTYGMLLEQSQNTAARLKAAGLGPGHLVAIARIRRGPAIADMLAAWAIGAAYVPVAMSLPMPRRDLILRTARPAAVLTDGDDLDGPGECVLVDDGLRRLPSDTAYVIFTSGSTGTPKGVVIGHAGLTALTRWHRDVSGLGVGRWGSQLVDLAFDASVQEIWGALGNGASIAVPGLDDLLEPVLLQKFLVEHQVEAGFVPTGLIPGLLDLDWPADCGVRVLFTGGDRLTRWPEARHPFQMINGYGPAECTVVATSHPLAPGPSRDQAPPIGRPLPHVQACVVVEGDRPAQAGQTGELWLAGPAVALGYLGQDPDSDPFVRRRLGGGPVRRWYRTGDLVTADESGVLHYVCRIDDQVQIGGRRTEPAEISRAILGMSQVTNAVVFTRQTPSGQPRLAVAVTPATVTRAEVQGHLRQLLPDYMIPAEVVALDTIPLTVNGKFDLTKLREAIAVGAVAAPGSVPAAAQV